MEIVKFGELLFDDGELCFKGFVFNPSYEDEPMTHAGKVKAVVRALNNTVTSEAFNRGADTVWWDKKNTQRLPNKNVSMLSTTKPVPSLSFTEHFNLVETSFEVVSLLGSHPMVEEVKREDGSVALLLMGTRKLLGFKTVDSKYYVARPDQPLHLLGE